MRKPRRSTGLTKSAAALSRKLDPVAINVKLSRELSEQCVLRQCYNNCFTLLPSMPEGTRYVEGWVLIEFGIPVEHAWLELADGTIVDPTLPLTRTTDEELEALRYFPAKKFTFSEIVDAATEVMDRSKRSTFTLPLLGGNGYDFIAEPWWQEAHNAMMAVAFPGWKTPTKDESE